MIGAEDHGFEEIEATEDIGSPPDELESINLMLDKAIATLVNIRSAIAALKKAKPSKDAAKKKAVRQEQKDRLWQRLANTRRARRSRFYGVTAGSSS